MRDSGRFGPIEWARAGRPLPSEYTSGDRGIAVDIDGEAALFALVDGLGHGPPAAEAALRAVDTVTAAGAEPIEVLIQLCHRALEGTRGVAMTLARIDFAANTLTWAGVGNVTAHLVAKAPTGTEVRSSARLAGGIVGYRIPEIRPAQVVSIRPGDLLVMRTDGIIDDYLDHIDFAAPALAIAEGLLGKDAKETDDAMVLAARHRGAST
ncbi:SpoIIE family protein phosphatase [Mycobacterium avium subsp. hominissuis]|uniref:Stage II sporulation protein M n=1 Tax=Mycobacterium bouchedurhonense TaxID=701041 RepID=A0ABX3SC47_MYCBC|nr:stage II sporulation E family protein [Mycobacterium avium MAV_120809_2495]MBG0725841.1 SpoIIE family protein phosphatase [Mycobacterium avium]ORA48674.1 stage II sporulation protein M [Mycobacterium bouchedurhonense]QGW30359.1 Stage II sporulation protein E (SpoIIE) [Mycobacterium avium subsp. avium]QNR35516.1 stage II sporulation protein M [Mycobacterium avium subsp. hominissuis]